MKKLLKLLTAHCSLITGHRSLITGHRSLITALCLLSSVLGLLFLTGCIARSVPRTTITGSLAGRPFSVSAPKDVDLASLKITATPDGAVSIDVEQLKTRMNPDVVTTTAEGQQKLIIAAGEAVAAGIKAAKP